MRGPAVDEGALEALAFMGATPALLSEVKAALGARAAQFWVWPENMPSVRALAMMATQWRVAGMGGYIGLDYNVLPFVFRQLGIGKKKQPEVFSGLQILEREVLSLMGEN